MTPTAVDFEQRYRELCDFVSIVAHDLRTPLTSIRGFAQLLQRQARAQDGESLRASLDTIVQQADRLAEYTEWLLEIARLETGRVALARTRVDLEHVAQEVAPSLGFALAFTRPCGGAPVVDADQRRVRHMVRALLEFASERSAATPAAPAPTISFDVQDGFGRLIVEDNGASLTADERAGLFERLVLTSDGGRRRSLAHVGLVIAAGMAVAHGGRLEVESPVSGSERGARLSLALPQAR
jgi:signal transduction histidine kinase